MIFSPHLRRLLASHTFARGRAAVKVRRRIAAETDLLVFALFGRLRSSRLVARPAAMEPKSHDLGR